MGRQKALGAGTVELAARGSAGSRTSDRRLECADGPIVFTPLVPLADEEFVCRPVGRSVGRKRNEGEKKGKRKTKERWRRIERAE